MLTTEIIVDNNSKINLLGLQKMNFEKDDSTSDNTDMDVSMKLVDEFGEVVMLIEVIPMDLHLGDDETGNKGCFIKRVFIIKSIINTQPWYDFLNKFLTAVNYKMIPCNNNRFIARYNYIWAEKRKGEFCIIAEILGLDKVYNNGETISYVGGLNNS